MNDDDYRINKNPVIFKKLENAQNIDKIVKIFAKDKLNHELKPNPSFIIVVGAPGVGKTTKSQHIIKKELDINYNDFYNISLDSIIERVKPYRNTTKRLYNLLKVKKTSLGKSNLNDKNFGILSEVYLPTIMSNKSIFSLNETELAKTNKIKAIGDESIKKQKKTIKKVVSGLKNINELRKEGLIYGVMNGLNIIYDTTLRPNKNIIKDDIISVLEMNKEVKYKIIVILVTSNVSNIKNRIKERHNKMLSENDPYIRAINPNLTELFVNQNKEGFNIAKKYFTSEIYKSEKMSRYTKDDFKFIEIDNPTIQNNTRKNNNNNNSFKYF